MLKFLIQITFMSLFISTAFAQEGPKQRDLNVAIGIDEVVNLDYRFNPKLDVAQKNIVQIISKN